MPCWWPYPSISFCPHISQSGMKHFGSKFRTIVKKNYSKTFNGLYDTKKKNSTELSILYCLFLHSSLQMVTPCPFPPPTQLQTAAQWCQANCHSQSSLLSAQGWSSIRARCVKAVFIPFIVFYLRVKTISNCFIIHAFG